MQRVWSTYLGQSGQASSHEMEVTPSHSRPASVSSHANSTYSQAASTRHMLSVSLDPPNPPFASNAVSPASYSPSGSLSGDDGGNVSLTVNYIPSKFSNSLLTGSFRNRKSTKGVDPILPKRGGGVDAFRSGEARIPGQGDDEDYDGVTSGWFGKDAPKKKMRWNKFKWTLFFANVLLTIYSLGALIVCLLTWFDVWSNADVVRVGNRTELIVSTIAASFGILTFIIGWAGILLNNRSFLAVYNLLLWVTFAWLVVPGYTSFRRRSLNLEGKINAQWSTGIGAGGRLRIQNQLQCCGYFSPFVEATVSQTCYARSILPGCKEDYWKFEKMVLARWYTVAFSIVPFHIGVMVAGLLCSNHVTYRFGKGMMPKAYRLSERSMAVIMDNYANQLAEQYGADIASDIVARSRSNLNLSSMAAMPYSSTTKTRSPLKTHQQSGIHVKYDSVGARAPEGVR